MALAKSSRIVCTLNFGKKPGSSKGTGRGTTKVAPKKGSSERPLWLPNAEAPEWLDGSLPGDRGFDPAGLAKPAEYFLFDVDSLDQNKVRDSMERTSVGLDLEKKKGIRGQSNPCLLDSEQRGKRRSECLRRVRASRDLKREKMHE